MEAKEPEKEDAFYGGEGDEALGEGRGLILDPFDGPVGFFGGCRVLFGRC